MAGTLVLDTLQNGAGTASTSADNLINGCAKAWVNINGDTGSIRASYNVTSVTKNGSGDYTINFTNAMPDANYGFNCSCQGAGAGNNFIGVEQHQGFTPTTSAIRILVKQGGTSLDRTIVCASIFR